MEQEKIHGIFDMIGFLVPITETLARGQCLYGIFFDNAAALYAADFYGLLCHLRYGKPCHVSCDLPDG